MACNYSSKFLPLIEYNKRMLLPHDPEGFHAFIVNSFNDDPDVIYKAINMPPYVKETKKTKEVVKVNTKQAFIVAEESNVNSAYLGRSDAYTSMVNQFRKKILEFARIQINFNTGEVRSFDSNALLPNSISVLNNNIFKYKLQLIENILSKTSDANKELFEGIKIRIEQELVSDNPDISKVDNDLNLLISTVKCLSTLDESTYDDFIQLTNFDKLLTQQCPYIEIDTRYAEDGVNKYKYVGSNVIHFSGWTANEFAVLFHFYNRDTAFTPFIFRIFFASDESSFVSSSNTVIVPWNIPSLLSICILRRVMCSCLEMIEVMLFIIPMSSLPITCNVMAYFPPLLPLHLALTIR